MRKDEIRIEITTEPEDITPEQAEELNGAYTGFAKAVKDVKKRATGRWGWCTAVVRVTTAEGVGEDSLGECSYESAYDFIKNSGHFDDMVKNALAEIEKRSLVRGIRKAIQLDLQPDFSEEGSQ